MPLCQTPVYNPNQPVNEAAPKPFPTERKEVPPSSKLPIAILISTVLASVAVCCGILNLFLKTQHTWSLRDRRSDYAVDLDRAPFAPPQKGYLSSTATGRCPCHRRLCLPIAVDLDGWDWYLHLALPIILLLGALFLFWGVTMGQRKRSTLSSIALVIASSGVFTLGVEGLIDGYLHGSWSPSWSLIVLAICVILLIPLIVIRRVPSLREEVRRRFHM